MVFKLGNSELIWDYDKNNTNAAKISDNNLKLMISSDTVWNMRDTVGYDDCCVGVHKLSENEFYFVTFLGLGFTMQIVNNTVTCIKKTFTK